MKKFLSLFVITAILSMTVAYNYNLTDKSTSANEQTVDSKNVGSTSSIPENSYADDGKIMRITMLNRKRVQTERILSQTVNVFEG